MGVFVLVLVEEWVGVFWLELKEVIYFGISMYSIDVVLVL